jgi:hypothetical protein
MFLSKILTYHGWENHAEKLTVILSFELHDPKPQSKIPNIYFRKGNVQIQVTNFGVLIWKNKSSVLL